MFGNNIKLERITMIDDSCMSNLLRTALIVTDGDWDKADKIVQYFTKNRTLPDTLPPTPNLYDKTKSIAGELFNAYSEHKDEIAEIITFISNIRKPAQPIEPLQPIEPKI